MTFSRFLVGMALSAVLFCVPAGGETSRPDLSTRQKRFESLTRVWAAVPGIFEDTISYPVPLMKILEEEQKLLEELGKHAEFAEAMAKRENYLTFDIETKQAVARKRVVVDQAAIDHWQT